MDPDISHLAKAVTASATEQSDADTVLECWHSAPPQDCRSSKLALAAAVGRPAKDTQLCLLQVCGHAAEDISNYKELFPSIFTAKALTNCDMFTLDAEEFHQVVQEYPKVQVKLHAWAVRSPLHRRHPLPLDMMPCFIMSCHVVFCCIASCRVMSCHVWTCRTWNSW